MKSFCYRIAYRIGKNGSLQVYSRHQTERAARAQLGKMLEQEKAMAVKYGPASWWIEHLDACRLWTRLDKPNQYYQFVLSPE